MAGTLARNSRQIPVEAVAHATAAQYKEAEQCGKRGVCTKRGAGPIVNCRCCVATLSLVLDSLSLADVLVTTSPPGQEMDASTLEPGAWPSRAASASSPAVQSCSGPQGLGLQVPCGGRQSVLGLGGGRGTAPKNICVSALLLCCYRLPWRLSPKQRLPVT